RHECSVFANDDAVCRLEWLLTWIGVCLVLHFDQLHRLTTRSSTNVENRLWFECACVSRTCDG
ncbi:hypothetical protein PMAYCL1PPCAC_21069, partial [Pristionchus mayeri]